MKANRIHRFGPPEVIAFEEVDVPKPAAGEVLVRVMAAAVGPWDALIRSGGSALQQRVPITLGADLAGVAEAVGPGASPFAVGEDVFGATDGFVGAYAQYALVPSRKLARKPVRCGYIDAASVPVVAVTARQMLERAGLATGQTVLIHGAAGGVGSYAVQFARARGVRIIAGASPSDTEYVRSLGADEVVDTRVERFEDRIPPVDAVLDTVGGDVQKRSFAILKEGGTLVSVVSQPDDLEARRRGVQSSFFYVDVTSADLQCIAQQLDAGTLRTLVGTVLWLPEAREAHEMLAGLQAHPRGKIVLRVAW